MVKHIANINSYIVSIDSAGILNAPGLKSGVIEHPTGGTGNSGNYIVADGNGGWSWSSATQTSVGEINDLTDALRSNTNYFIGELGGQNVLTNTSQVTAYGHNAGMAITSGSSNTLLGSSSGKNITSGLNNTLIGASSGTSLTTHQNNIFIGRESARQATSQYSLYIGVAAGFSSSSTHNIGIGHGAAFDNDGQYNVIIGPPSSSHVDTFTCHQATSSFSGNVVIGEAAMQRTNIIPARNGQSTWTGNHNVVIGKWATLQQTTSSNAIAIGYQAFADSNQIVIGNNSNTEFYLPGLQQNANSGDVLTFDGTKINLSALPANTGTVVEPFSVSSIGGLFTMTSLTGYYTMFHTYIDVEFSRISLYTMSDTSGASGTIVAGVFSNLSFAPNTSLSQASTSFSSVTGVTEIIIDFNTVQLSPHNKYWLGISVQTTSGTLYLAKSALGTTDNYFALSEASTFNGTTLSAPVSPSPSSFNFYYRLHRPSAPGGIVSNSTTVPTAIEVAHAEGFNHASTQNLTSNTVYTKIRFRTSGFYSSSNYRLSTSNSNIKVLTDGLYSIHFTGTTRLETGSNARTTSSIALFINGVVFASSEVHTYNRVDPQSDNSASYTHVGYFTAGTQFDFRIKLDDGNGPIRVKDNGNHLTIMKLSN